MLEISRARFGGGGALGLAGIDFEAFSVSWATFGGAGALGPQEAFWRSPRSDFEVMGTWINWINFEAFGRSPGLGFNLMGHLHLQE